MLSVFQKMKKYLTKDLLQEQEANTIRIKSVLLVHTMGE